MTDDQIEQSLMTPGHGGEHLASCAECRERLQEARALRGRVRSAFASVRADEALRGDVLGALRAAERGGSRGRVYRFARLAGPRVAAAAVVAVMSVLLVMHLGSPQNAVAASAELAQIHQGNLLSHVGLHGVSDAETVAAFFRSELGFEPALPQIGAGMALRGCCVAHFRNRPVGSYVLETDRGVVSVIVLRDKVETLKLGGTVGSHGRNYHRGTFARNTLVAAETGGYTYCIVGEADAVWMADILDSLLAE